LAADTLVIEMPDDAGLALLLISHYRAAFQAARIQTVVTGRGHILLVGLPIQLAND